MMKVSDDDDDSPGVNEQRFMAVTIMLTSLYGPSDG